MISSKFELLQKQYDVKIRKQCDHFNDEMEKCLKNNFDDHFVCKPILDSFECCIQDFNSKFLKNQKIIELKKD